MLTGKNMKGMQMVSGGVLLIEYLCDLSVGNWFSECWT